MFSYVPYGVTGIRQEQIFGGALSQQDAGPVPISAANNTTPGTEASMPMSEHAVTISWLGLLLALILLRIVYELSD